MEKQKVFWQDVCIILFLVMAITSVVPESASAVEMLSGGRIITACDRLLMLIEGSLGALVTTAAGIGAIVCSALGGFRSAWTLLVVSVGSFILRSYVTLFFAPCTSFL
jgi:hypothetical protein